MKKCKGCKLDKELIEFYHKYYSLCKPCHSKSVKDNQRKKSYHYNLYRVQYAADHPEKVEQWRLNHLKNLDEAQGIPLQEFRRNKFKERLLDPEYRQMILDRISAKFEMNLMKKKEYHRKYYLKNIEKFKARAKEIYQSKKKKNSI